MKWTSEIDDLERESMECFVGRDDCHVLPPSEFIVIGFIRYHGRVCEKINGKEWRELFNGCYCNHYGRLLNGKDVTRCH